MQSDLLNPSEFVQEQHVEAAVASLVAIVNDEHSVETMAKDRIHAAELLLRYGVRDPYWAASPDQPEAED